MGWDEMGWDARLFGGSGNGMGSLMDGFRPSKTWGDQGLGGQKLGPQYALCAESCNCGVQSKCVEAGVDSWKFDQYWGQLTRPFLVLISRVDLVLCRF